MSILHGTAAAIRQHHPDTNLALQHCQYTSVNSAAHSVSCCYSQCSTVVTPLPLPHYCPACLRCCQRVRHATTPSPAVSSRRHHSALVLSLYHCAWSTLLLLLISSHWITVLCTTNLVTSMLDNVTTRYTNHTAAMSSSYIDDVTSHMRPPVHISPSHLIYPSRDLPLNSRHVEELCSLVNTCDRLKRLFTDNYSISYCPFLRLMDVILVNGTCETNATCTDDEESSQCHLPSHTSLLEVDRWSQFSHENDLKSAWTAWRQLLWQDLKENCWQFLMQVVALQDETRLIQSEFSQLMQRYFYDDENEIERLETVKKCTDAYEKWICSEKFPLSFPVSHSPARSQRVVACDEWCSNVEMKCPYLPPLERDENGGEPAFLCNASHYSADPKALNNLLCDSEQCCYSSSRFSLLQQGPGVNCSSPTRLYTLCTPEEEEEEVASNVTSNATSSASRLFASRATLSVSLPPHLEKELSLLLLWMTSSYFLLLCFGAVVTPLFLIATFSFSVVMSSHGGCCCASCCDWYPPAVPISLFTTSRCSSPTPTLLKPTAQRYWIALIVTTIGIVSVLCRAPATNSTISTTTTTTTYDIMDGVSWKSPSEYHANKHRPHHESASMQESYRSRTCVLSVCDLLPSQPRCGSLCHVPGYLLSQLHSLLLFTLRSAHVSWITLLSLTLSVTLLSWLM